MKATTKKEDAGIFLCLSNNLAFHCWM